MRPSLKTKLLGLAFLGVALTALGTGGVAYWFLYRESLRALDARAQALARALSAELEEYLLSNDLYGAHRLLLQTLDEEVRSTYVMGPSGQVLLHTFSEGFPQVLLRFPGHLDYRTGRNTYHQRAAPILEGQLGEVRVIVSEGPFHARLRQTIAHLALAILGVALATGGLAYRVALAFLRPIQAMVQDVEALRLGKVDRIREPEGELAALAQSFNAYFAQARDREAELLDLQRVAEAVNRAETPEEVLEVALETLVATGRFRCGDAYLRRGEGYQKVSSRACVSQACPLREEALTQEPPPGFQKIPLGQDALLVLLGGEGSSEAFLQGLFAPIAVGLERARYYESLREKEALRAQFLRSLVQAQEEERARIARDLHDEVGQALTGLSLGLEAAQNDPNPARFQALKRLVESTREEVRRLARALRPAVLDTLGLEAALKRLASEVSEQSGVEAKVVHQLRHRLHPEEETTLFRVVQEALTNAVRHAQASQVSILLMEGPEGVRLVVEDDGRGFDPQQVGRDGHMGLLNLRERMELIGGRLEVESAPGQGTTLYAHLPRREG